jgi:hypothetical protein
VIWKNENKNWVCTCYNMSKDENRLTSEVFVNFGPKHERGQAPKPAISSVGNGNPQVCSILTGQIDA